MRCPDSRQQSGAKPLCSLHLILQLRWDVYMHCLFLSKIALTLFLPSLRLHFFFFFFALSVHRALLTVKNPRQLLLNEFLSVAAGLSHWDLYCAPVASFAEQCVLKSTVISSACSQVFTGACMVIPGLLRLKNSSSQVWNPLITTCVTLTGLVVVHLPVFLKVGVQS